MFNRSRHRSHSLLAAILLVSACALAKDQDQARDFHWTGKLAPDQIVEIKNLNGKIDARGDSSSDQIEVTAEKIGPSPGPCKPGQKWHVNSHNAKVKVNFTVHLPSNLRFSADSINGSITAED